ncbi:hypothetical protein SAMN05216256_10726 [Halopseudomonas pachastrellae]|nr:hypothetical protein SAMN05216256_10726 [Halopseudomonas pachastrellae]
MLSCKGLVALSSDLLDGELTWKQRIAVRTHWRCVCIAVVLFASCVSASA